MKPNMKQKILHSTAALIHATSVKSVNSACGFVWGQHKEPVSLKKFKKNI